MDLTLVFVLGLAVGSFLNVCIVRLPQGESVIAPRSRCPRCKAPIAAYYNIPLLSYVLLGGRCRSCQERISVLYPAVELLTALLFISLYLRDGPTWHFLAGALFISLLIPLIFIDFRHFILPDAITLPGMLIGLILSPIQPPERWQDSLTLALYSLLNVHSDSHLPLALFGSLLGIVLGGGLLWLVAEGYYRLRRVEGLGFGDIKMMGMVGAFLGWKLAWLTVFLASFAGSLFGVYLMAARGRGLRHQLYFGSFLGAAAIVSLYYGSEILNWYFSWPGS